MTATWVCLLLPLHANADSSSPSRRPAPAHASPPLVTMDSAGLGWALYADDRSGGRRLNAKDSVQPGVRVGFVVSARRTLWVSVVGTDETGKRYLIAPPRERVPRAVPVAAGILTTLPMSVRFDARGKRENLSLVACPKRFDPTPLLRHAPPPECVVVRRTVLKSERNP